MNNPLTDEDSRHITLDTYEELVGRLLEIYQNDELLLVRTSSGTLRFLKDTVEARIALSDLEGHEGSRIRILRIQNSTNPILIDVDEE